MHDPTIREVRNVRREGLAPSLAVSGLLHIYGVKFDPGEYHLRSTGEVVVNPDYLSAYIVERGPKGEILENEESGAGD